ncbi:MAG: cytidine deaminase [Bacteroidales bacterium]|nr:cytidine deaminase [Bacteroidales bacterium]
MEEKSILIKYFVCCNREELSVADREVLVAAEKAILAAYSPYSHFRVGAAVRLDNGCIVQGNNQENAAYPQGLCAERVALFYAMSQYADNQIVTMAVCGENSDIPVSPCGGCRQVMLEYEQRTGNKMRIIIASKSSQILIIEGVENLLPLHFCAKNLQNL